MRRLALLFTCILAACGPDTASDSALSLESQNYTEALTSINAQLVENPADPTLNAQAIIARLGVCVAENCFALTEGENSFENLVAPIQSHLTFAAQQTDPTAFDYPTNLQNVLASVQSLSNPLTAYGELLKLTTSSAFQTAITPHLFNTLTTHLQENWATTNQQTFKQNLQNLIASQAVPEPSSSMLGVILGLINRQETLIRGKAITLRQKAGEGTLPVEAWTTLTLAYLHYEYQNTPQRQAATRFVQNLYPFITQHNWPESLWNLQSRIKVAQTLQALKTHPQTGPILVNNQQGLGPNLAEIQPSVPQAPNTPTPTLVSETIMTTADSELTTNPQNTLDLYLTRLSLILQGQNASDTQWETFLKTAATYIETTQDVTLIEAPLTIAQIPENQHGRYRNALFTALEVANENQSNIVPLLTLFEPMELDNPTQVRLEKNLQTALEHALTNRNVERALAYSRLNPQVAQNQRQAIVPLLVSALQESFARDAFEQVMDLSNALQTTLAIDFNLDSILLQAFNTFLEDQDTLVELSTDDPTLLTQPQADVAYNFGPKLRFLQQHFAGQTDDTGEPRDIINNLLKGLILRVDGAYGTPNALYRLDHAFEEAMFPQTERQAYLLSSLRSAIGQDTERTANQILTLGYQLQQQHPDLTDEFIINEVLGRLETITESQTAWRHFKQPNYASLLTTLKQEEPDFVALMTGIDAFEAENFAAAVTAFSTLTQPYYIQLAKPYMQHYLQTREKLRGLYVMAPFSSMSHPLAFIALGESNPLSATEITDPTTLTQIPFTLINRVGTYEDSETTPLVTNFGTVTRANGIANLDFSNMTLRLSENTRINTNRYGQIEKLTHTPTNTLRLRPMPDADTLTLRALSSNPFAQLPPAGTYSVTATPQGQTAETQHLLPTGTQLSFTTSPTPTIVTGTSKYVYEVSGQLTHPAKPANSLTITGIYNPQTHLTSLQFDYPLPDGTGNTAPVTAYARCQILPETLLCASHNAHNLRQQYHHLTRAKRIEN